MIHVWRVNLDGARALEPSPEEAARAERFATAELARRYLAAHAALRAILRRYTLAPLEFAVREMGKPYLARAPEVRFNLAHSRGRGLVAVSREREVGADIECIRPMPKYAELAERFFPPGEEAPAGEADFFRRWTRWEALLKARGVGLFGAGIPAEGEWTVAELDAGEGCAAAVACAGGELAVEIYDWGAER